MSKLVIVILLATLVSNNVFAREDRINLNIIEAYQALSIDSQLGGVKMYFGNQSHPSTNKKMSVIRTNRKTNAFNKTDKKACEWVFLSAILALRDSALSQGGNAVVNIKSNYDNIEYSSPSEFQCGVGRIIAGVALIGQVVNLSSGGVTKPSTNSKNTTNSTACTTKQILDMKKTGLTEDQIVSACG